jgi:hypothetical protein
MSEKKKAEEPGEPRFTQQGCKLVNKDGTFIEICILREADAVQFSMGRVGEPQKVQIVTEAFEAVNFLGALVRLFHDQINISRMRFGEKLGQELQQKLSQLVSEQLKHMREQGGTDDWWKKGKKNPEDEEEE